MTTDVWTPPPGSVEIEPGWWQAPNGSIYSDPATQMPAVEEMLQARADAREQAAQRVRQEAALVPDLIDRMQDLEMQAYLAEQFFAASLELLREQCECEEFLEALLAGVLSERA